MQNCIGKLICQASSANQRPGRPHCSERQRRRLRGSAAVGFVCSRICAYTGASRPVPPPPALRIYRGGAAAANGYPNAGGIAHAPPGLTRTNLHHWPARRATQDQPATTRTQDDSLSLYPGCISLCAPRMVAFADRAIIEQLAGSSNQSPSPLNSLFADV